MLSAKHIAGDGQMTTAVRRSKAMSEAEEKKNQAGKSGENRIAKTRGLKP